MKYLSLMIATIGLMVQVNAQTNTHPKKQNNMKLNAGIITSKLAESKAFYTGILGMEVTFENEFYLLLHTPGNQASISFLLPDHPSQQALFHESFQGQGMYLTIEVDDVDKMYKEIKQKGVEIKIDIRDEPWGDRHFAITDPNGVGIDIVHYQEPARQ
jgi:catechol 2,3-dioxygenase-like lactoylglutathione lyase family enzyme